MQRIKALIDKLNIQFEQKARPAEMLTTLQLLQKEIIGGLKETEMLGSSNVSVLIPNIPLIKQSKLIDFNKDEEKVYFELSAADGSDEEIAELLLQNEKITRQSQVQRELSKTIEAPKNPIKQAEIDFNDDENSGINNVPTFAQYIKTKNSPGDSIINNHTVEQEAPKKLKDLISKLDNQMFLKDLFKGDEDMYERSIKTIDNFQEYAEAEFWIRRELKLKLAWMQEDPTVDHFDRLVKRRFA